MRVSRFLSRGVVAWAVGCLCLMVWVCDVRAQDEDEIAKRKRLLLNKQLTCLQQCQDIYHARLSRCGSVGYNSSCFVYGKLYMTHCLRMCRVPWFCRGFSKTYKQCPTNCMKDAMQKIKGKRWDKRRKRWIRLSKSQVKRKMSRAKRGCIGICKVMTDMCSSDLPKVKTIKMPTLPR